MDICDGVVPSLCENEVYPWPRDVVRALRGLDPFVVPVAVKYLCRRPDKSRYTLFRHGIGILLGSDQESEHHDYIARCIVPVSPGAVNGHLAGRRVIWQDILTLAPDPENPLPGGVFGPYRAFDWSVVRDYRLEHATPQQMARMREDQRQEAERRRLRSWKNEHDYRWDGEWSYLMRLKDKLDVNDRRHANQPLTPAPKQYAFKGAA